MFCYQCQETAQNKGCTVKGVCGKTEDVSDIQDILIFVLKGIAQRATGMINRGEEVPKAAYELITDSLFMTITNANFDRDSFIVRIQEALNMRDSLALPDEVFRNQRTQTLEWDDVSKLMNVPEEVGVLSTKDEDKRSLRELLIYGLKGISAYADHAFQLGFEDNEIYEFVVKALTATTEDLSVEELTDWVIKCGTCGVRTMALLDKANTTTYGNPEITEVNIGVGKRPGILISGHDLHDMEDLLKQTEGTGVDVYTHSEMLPAHYYPAFKKYSHFVGNYGGSWWRQVEEFEHFNGVFLFTTNCIVPPKKASTYVDRVYTTGSAGYPGFKHIPDREPGKMKDFSELIEQAKKCAPPEEIEKGKIVGGFAHYQVEQLADKVVEAVKSGAISRFVVMAGCDGRMKSREYYTQFAEQLPKDSVILTAGCAKYRYNKLDLGTINGIPRVLDAGQCNDSYSLVMIALKLKELFGVESINDLPIVYNIAWYEQKALIVLLALLSLGVKDIHAGPTLPGFLTPNVAKVLIDTFNLGTISTVEEDIAAWC